MDFFFVLSGFLITTLLLREERLTGRISLAAFYRRRALRILPVYLLLVTAMSLYWIGVKGQWDLLGMVPYYYVFLANFLKDDIPLLSITWSLSVEEQYYLIWPALLILLPQAKPRLGLVVLLVGLCLLGLLGLAEWLDLPRLETAHAIFRLPVMSYMAILCGSLMAILLNHPAGFRWIWRLCGWQGASPVLFAILLLYLQMMPGSLLGWPTLGMNVLMALCLASLVVREDHALRPVMTLAPVARIGEISYGIYLYHLIALHVANMILPQGGWSVTLFYPVVSIAIAEVSFRSFERHFLSLKTAPIQTGTRMAEMR